MLPCYIIFFILLICISGIVCLLLHHRAKHGNKMDVENYLQDPCDQWFQVSDVCNFKTCSHEMWILFLLFTLIVVSCISMHVECE